MTSAHPKLIVLATAFTLVLAIDALAVASTASAGFWRAAVSCTASGTEGHDGLSPVVLVADRGLATAVAAHVRAVGGRVCDRFGRLVEARIPARAAHALGRDATVRPAPRPYAMEFDEGVASTNASAWQARGLGGVGVAVAVIDMGFGGLREEQAAGRVPSGAVSVDFCPSHGFFGDKHGTAVAEVVAAEAPAARIYLICVDDVVS